MWKKNEKILKSASVNQQVVLYRVWVRQIHDQISLLCPTTNKRKENSAGDRSCRCVSSQYEDEVSRATDNNERRCV